MGLGLHKDFQTQSTFSLETITETVEAIVTALFDAGSVPEGSKLTLTDAAKKASLAVAPYAELAKVAALAFLGTLMRAFETKIDISFQSTMQSRSIAPGLMLHLWTFGEGYERKDIANEETVIANVISYQLIYSFKQAQVQMNIEAMSQHRELIYSLEQTISTLQVSWEARLSDPKATTEELDALESRIDRGRKMIQMWTKEVDDIVAKMTHAAKQLRLAHVRAV